MLLALQPYDLKVHYTKGSDLKVADALSRAYLSDTGTDHTECPVEVFLIKEQAPLSPEKFEEFKAETVKDEVLKEVLEVTSDGWPANKEDCPPICREYWNVHDELSVVDGVLFKSDRVVVPTCLRKGLLQKLHESHFGVVRCKHRAREAMFWPGMNKAIEDMIEQCSVCHEHTRHQQREPLRNHDIPDTPWTKVGADCFEYKNVQYLLVVDYCSKFPEIYCLQKDLRAKNVIKAFKSIFSRHGIPQELVTDNARYFDCYEFKEFCTSWQFKHTTSSPRYPKSNGEAERYVQTIKNVLKKSNDPCYALLEYRTTPLSGVGYSPAQLLMGRRLNTKLPMSKNMLKPTVVNWQKVKEGIEENQWSQKKYYDKGTKPLVELTPGESVRVWKEKDGLWKPGVVQKVADEPRSYWIKGNDGSVLRRNRNVIRKTVECENVQTAPSKSTSNIVSMGYVYNRTKIPRLTNVRSRLSNESLSSSATPNVSSNRSNTSASATPNKNMSPVCTRPGQNVTRSGRPVKLPARYSS